MPGGAPGEGGGAMREEGNRKAAQEQLNILYWEVKGLQKLENCADDEQRCTHS